MAIELEEGSETKDINFSSLVEDTLTTLSEISENTAKKLINKNSGGMDSFTSGKKVMNLTGF